MVEAKNPSRSNGARKPYLLQLEEGERRLLGPRQAPNWIKADPSAGSSRLTAIMEYISPGDGIPEHLHENEDELIFIHAGEALVLLDGEEHRAQTGALAFVPQGVWHAVRNASEEELLTMLAVFNPPGIEGYFRVFSTEPGESWEGMSVKEEEALEKKHGIVYRGS